MKKIVLAVLTLFSITIYSQTTYTDLAGKWRIGLNVGAMWQTCDVTAHANIAGGFTIEKILNKKADALIGFSLGLRYLSGHCSGLDTKGSSGVANNTALNGNFDSTLNYAKNGGIFYNNYKTYIHEGALELKINFPRFEQNTHLIFHVMGGIGVCNYKTWINARDADGNMYDFTALQNAQSVTSADVKKVLTGSYGTLAQGSSPSGTNCFVPSVGVGFGFKLSKHAALVFEYRASFPGTNLLDGVTHNINNELIKQNDFYNYASANLLFTIYGKQTKSTYNNTNNYTNPNTQTNNTVPNTTINTSNAPVYTAQQPVYTNQQPQVNPPYVSITSPVNNFSSQSNYISVQGNVQNVQSSHQISISQNGYPIKYFSYDTYNGNIHFQTFLQQGTNNIIITANSQYGTGSQGVTVFYNPPYVPNGNVVYQNEGNTTINNTVETTSVTTSTVQTQTVITTLPNVQTAIGHGKGKPVVQFINPFSSPEDVSAATYNVNATVQNIAAANQITVTVNGSNVPQFNFNASTNNVTFATNLLVGFNSIQISATNTAGSDVKSTVIDYKPVGKPPRIDIFNPATSPFTSQQPNIIVSGYVYNVLSSSDITAIFNGSNIAFSYNNATHEIEIPVNLSNNANQLTILATNAAGKDIKQLTLLLLNQNTISVNPHTGIIPNLQTQPNYTVNPRTHNQIGGTPTNTVQTQPTYTANPNMQGGNTQTQPNYTINPNMQGGNVQTQTNYTVHPNMQGGNTQTQLNYTVNPAMQAEGTVQTNQTNGNSTGNATSANSQNGMGGLHHKPEITRTSPTTSPYTTMSGVISISANLNFVVDATAVSVMYDGNQVSFSYNPHISEQLNFTSPLKPGMNTFVIKAGNQFGVITQNVDINYVPTNPNGNVNGNPSLHFSGGLNNSANTPRANPTINTPPAQVSPEPAKPTQIQPPTGGGRPMVRPR